MSTTDEKTKPGERAEAATLAASNTHQQAGHTAGSAGETPGEGRVWLPVPVPVPGMEGAMRSSGLS